MREMMPELPMKFDLPLARRLAEFSRRAYEAGQVGTARCAVRAASSGATQGVTRSSRANRSARFTGGDIAARCPYQQQEPCHDASPCDAHVLVEDIGDAIVLAFRGTKDARDWLTDVEFRKFPLFEAVRRVADHNGPVGRSPQKRIKVHEGFLRAIVSLLPKIIEWLEGPDMGSAPKPLLITGHSLGGALASLAAFFLQQRGHPIRAVYTFASPRVGNGAWRDQYNSAGSQGERATSPLLRATRPQALGAKTFRVAAAGDLVPLIPGLMDGYRHVGQEVFLDGAETFNIQHSTSNVEVNTELKIRINPSHIWEFLQDEWRAIRALGRGDLDFILQFHSIEKDYIPLLAEGRVTREQPKDIF